MDVLTNSNNKMFHRMGHSSQQSTAAKKSCESMKKGERIAELQPRINDEKVALKKSQAELQSLKGTSASSTNPRGLIGRGCRHPNFVQIFAAASRSGVYAAIFTTVRFFCHES